MDWLSYLVALTASTLEVIILVRATQGHFLGRFPIFYSYILFTLCWGSYVTILWKAWPEVYARVFWFHFATGALAEFAILVEVSDHLFHPFPAIRRLGRLLTLSLIVVLSLFIVPALLEPRSSTVAILDCYKRAALAKALIIIALLAVARHYGLPRGKNVMGLMLGFSLYLCVEVVNFALAQQFGAAAYGSIFAIAGPSAFVLGLTIWTAALWRYEPVSTTPGGPQPDGSSSSGTLGGRLEGFNDLLGNALRK